MLHFNLDSMHDSDATVAKLKKSDKQILPLASSRTVVVVCFYFALSWPRDSLPVVSLDIPLLFELHGTWCTYMMATGKLERTSEKVTTYRALQSSVRCWKLSD